MNVHTFSICAVNAETGEAGVAVASCCLSVGGIVPYAEPGVGAIATQAFVSPRYGTRGLELLRSGLTPQEALHELVREDRTVTDDHPETVARYGKEQMRRLGEDYIRDRDTGKLIWFTSRIRQVGMVDKDGNAAVHDGACIFPWAGSVTGAGFCCQGNLLAGEDVMTAMAETFERERSDGSHLARPLFAALAAGERAGGDKRGRLAAGMLVVREDGHWTGSDAWCNIRVDSHTDPVAELGRILVQNGFTS